MSGVLQIRVWIGFGGAVQRAIDDSVDEEASLCDAETKVRMTAAARKEFSLSP